MIQIRQGSQTYSFHRDLANCFIPACELSLETIFKHPTGDWSKPYCDWAGLTEEQLGQVAVAFAAYCAKITDPQHQTAGDTLKAAGFFDCPGPAQVAFLARLGIVFTGMAWNALREANEPHSQPAGLAALLNQAQALIGLLEDPRS